MFKFCTWLTGLFIPLLVIYLGANFVTWGEYINLGMWSSNDRAAILIITVFWSLFWTMMVAEM